MAVTNITVAPASANSVLAMAALLTENGAGTYTATFPLPANAELVNIIVDNIALWTAGTSAGLIVGDDSDDDGYITTTSLKATDLLAGETLSLESTQRLGGLAGAYATVGTSTHLSARGGTAARNIIAKVVSVGAGTAGRTRVTVLYTTAAPTIVTQ